MRAATPNRGSRPFVISEGMDESSEDLAFEVHCECNQWHWREMRASDGLSYDERYCPICKRQLLIVIRGTSLVGVVRSRGQNPCALRRALQQLALSRPEVETLVASTVHSEGRRHRTNGG